MIKFQAGKIYYTRCISDYNFLRKFKIVRRTEKSVWIDLHGKIVRRSVRVFENIEFFYPDGCYTYAGDMIKADMEERKNESTTID